jgi:ABC-type sugar transport system permease subunit
MISEVKQGKEVAVKKEKTKERRKLNPQTKKNYMWAYIFIAPQVLVFLVLSLYPIVMSYVYSFYDWQGIGPLENFVGFDNYIRLMNDPRFWGDFLNTVIYVVGTTVIGVLFALILAIILNDNKMRGKTFYRTIYFLPVVTTTAIVGIIMENIFGVVGLANTILKTLGIVESPVPFLTNGAWAMTVLILVGSWKGLGITMIYWLAGLQGISSDLYESAQLDGAGFWKTLRHITLPLLKPILAVIVLLSIVSGMHVFDLVKTLTDGGPYFKTETLDLYIYNYAFTDSHDNGISLMGFASAAGVVLGIFTFIISSAFGGVGFAASINNWRKKRKAKKAGELIEE